MTITTGDLMNEINALTRELATLRADNARLREGLEQIRELLSGFPPRSTLDVAILDTVAGALRKT